MNLPESIAQRVTIETDTGHWLWRGRPNHHGYGRIGVDGRLLLAHRYVYEQLVGPIPTGMVIDHICRVRHCVAPHHLRVVTRTQNTLENSRSRGAERKAWTHCPNGHPFDEANTLRQNKGRQRLCRTCRNTYMREYMRERTRRSA